MYDFRLTFIVDDDSCSFSVPASVVVGCDNKVLSGVLGSPVVQHRIDSLLNTVHLFYNLALEGVDINNENEVKECFEL